MDKYPSYQLEIQKLKSEKMKKLLTPFCFVLVVFLFVLLETKTKILEKEISYYLPMLDGILIIIIAIRLLFFLMKRYS